MDALSDVLRVVRLSAGVFLDAEFTAPWSVSSQVGPEDCYPGGDVPERLIAFHYVVAGHMAIEVEGSGPLDLRPGTVALLPRNDPHVIASAAGLPAVDPQHLVQVDPDSGLMRIRYGGGGAATRIVCGYIGIDTREHPLLDSLPPLLALDLADKPAAEWVATSFRYAAGQLASVSAGAAIALAKLSELIFIEAVRHYIESLPEDRRGWLAGLRDPVVGRALALMHAQVARAWTAEELARAVFLSRSAFAERFTSLLGMPPMTYLGNWRMQVAAQRLRDSQRALAQVAAEVGYESEAAFSRAFKRAHAVSPAQWRRQAQARVPDAARRAG